MRKGQPSSSRARTVRSGGNQAVCLPNPLQFNSDEVIAKRFANGVLLPPIDDPWQVMREALNEFEPGLVLERDQPVR